MKRIRSGTSCVARAAVALGTLAFAAACGPVEGGPPIPPAAEKAPDVAPQLTVSQVEWSQQLMFTPTPSVPARDPPRTHHAPRSPRLPPLPTVPYQPPPPVVTVQGRVLGPDGKPVAGAEVAFGRDVSSRPHTDADGRFLLGIDALTLRQIDLVEPVAAIRFLVPGCEPWQSARLQLLPGLIDLGDVQLRRAAELSGRCVDESGEPVAGAVVQVTHVVRADLDQDGWPTRRDWYAEMIALRSDPEGRGHATTDSTGSFTLANLPLGTYDLNFDHSEFRAAQLDGVPLGAGSCSIGDVQLTAGRSLSGHIVDADGRPFALVTLRVRTEAGWERFWRNQVLHSARVEVQDGTDEAGNFVVSGLAPGAFVLEVWTEERAPAETFGPFEAGATGIEIRSTRRVPPPPAPEPVAVQDTPRPRCSVSGTVLDVDGSPLAGATVSIHSGKVVTAADGTFVLKILAGWPGELYVNCAGHVPLVTAKLPLDGDCAGLVVRMPVPGSLQARMLVGPGVNPSAGVFELCPIDLIEAAPVTLGDGTVLAATPLSPGYPGGLSSGRHPNGDGRLEWPWLVPGEYELRGRLVSDNFMGYAQFGSRAQPAALAAVRVRVLPGEAAVAELRIPAPGQLHGRVTIDGEAAEGVDVVALVGDAGGHELRGRACTDASGAWCLDDLPPAHYRVVFHVPRGYVPMVVEADVAAGQDSDAPGLETRFTSQRIEGRVLAADDGLPLAGIDMDLLPPVLGWCGVRDPSLMNWRTLGGSFAEPVTTDASGRFCFEHVPDGLYEIVARTPGRAAGPPTIVLLPSSPDGPEGILAFGGPRQLHDPLHVELRVQPAPQPTLRVRVTWPDGTTPFTTAIVSIEKDGQSVSCPYQWPGPGQFEFTLERPGDYSLVVHDQACHGIAVLRREVSLQAGQTVELAIAVP